MKEKIKKYQIIYLVKVKIRKQNGWIKEDKKNYCLQIMTKNTQLFTMRKIVVIVLIEKVIWHLTRNLKNLSEVTRSEIILKTQIFMKKDFKTLRNRPEHKVSCKVKGWQELSKKMKMLMNKIQRILRYYFRMEL